MRVRKPADNELMDELTQLRERNTVLEAREAEYRITRNSLERSEKLLRSAFDTIPDLVAIIDKDYRILISNWHGGCDYVSEESRSGNPVCHEAYHGQKTPCRPCLVREVFRTGRPAIWKKWNPGIGQVEIRAYPVFDESGNVELVVEHVCDITSRNQAELELKKASSQAERLLRFSEALLSAIPTPVFYKDRQGRYLGCNSAFTEIMGVTSEQIKGKTVMELWPDEFAEVYHNKDIELMNNPVRQVYEYLVRDKDGIGRTVMYAKNVFRDENGQVAGIVGAFLDISDRKKAEEQLKESEMRFRTIFDNNTDGLIVADVEKRSFVLVNPMICAMLGYTEEELAGMSVMDIHPTDAVPYVFEQFERQARGEIRVAEKLPVKKKDGTVFYADVNTSPLRLGGRDYLIGAFRDVTERELARESVISLNQELERKVEERTSQLLEAQEELVRKERLSIIGQLSSSVGNELRNPLGVMNNAIYFLRLVNADTDETTREYLDIIKHEIDNSQRIIGDFLDFVLAKPPRKTTVRVRDLIAESLEGCTLPAAVAIRSDFPDTLPPVHVDPVQMKQVFRNLITNALQAMSGEGSLHISAKLVRGSGFEVRGSEESNLEHGTLNSEPDTAFIEISFADCGTGVSEENMNKLFQPLFTTRARGIGLGLATSRNLTEANGGAIRVASRSGEGSTFTVRLPAAGTEEKS